MINNQKTIGLGIIGCGNISQAYFDAAKKFEILKIISCADINESVAQAKAKENEAQAQTVGELLANPDVDLVINLTIPAVHAEVSLAALKAGKHVHCEKPLATTLEDGRKVLDYAAERGLRVGCAPDTFLGAGLQTCRKLVDDGWIGRPLGGSAFMMCRGPEYWHPNPAFFYQQGAGPMFDMGPYYLTALVHLLGPVTRVCAITTKAFEERTATCEAQFGAKLAVGVPTHFAGTLEFVNGAVVTLTISFDVHQHGHSPIEIYGTEGTLHVPDPNTFGGPVKLWTQTDKQVKETSLSHCYAENMRSIGAADLAYGILSGRPHRCSGELAYHILELMHAFELSSDTGRHITIESRPIQPNPLPLGLIEGRLDP
jgi:predicted dehydrogenase